MVNKAKFVLSKALDVSLLNQGPLAADETNSTCSTEKRIGYVLSNRIFINAMTF